MVTGSPVLSMRRSAATARRRVAWARRRAASMTWWELSARIGRPRSAVPGSSLERVDDAVEVAQDLLVHLDQPGLAAGLGGGDELDDLRAVGAVLGQELRGGDEHRAGQAGVGVRAGLLDRQPAEPVGQRLGRPAEALLGPGGLGEWPGRVDHDDVAGDVDLAGGLPVPADGGVVQPGVVGGHLRGVVIEDAPHDFLRDIPVDQPGAEGVPPLVRGQVHRAAVFVVDVAAGQPAAERDPVGRGGGRCPAVGVLRRPREQHRRLSDADLLRGDQGVELFVDGDQGLAFILWLT